MKIHTVNPGETAESIAREYEVSGELIKLSNDLKRYAATDGEELLVLKPTRTYKTRIGDSTERISLRFGVRESDIIAMNPWIRDSGISEGKTVVLKYGEQRIGNAASNGYYYDSCTREDLLRAMPYLTYVTIASGVFENGNIRNLFSPKEIAEICTANGRIPLLRIFNKTEPENQDGVADYIEKAITSATAAHCKGLVLPMQCKNAPIYKDMITDMKKAMLGKDLILIIEADENSSPEFSSLADGCFLSYYKFALDEPKSFGEGEREFFSRFATEGESAKAFIDLPSMARRGERFFKLNDTLEEARRQRLSITKDDSTLLSSFAEGKDRFIYTSLENIKATLDIVNEYGFMGVCFDIMRTPMNHFLMYNALFKTVTQPRATSREGCSREL